MATIEALLEQPRAGSLAAKSQPETDVAEDNLAQLVSYYEDAQEQTEGARQRAERDRDYYDGKQLTAEELKVLKERGQPDVIINRVQDKIDFILGYEASNRTDPKGFPRTPQDEEASEAATDGLRYIKDSTALDQKFSTEWEYMLIEGVGAIEWTIEPQPPKPDGTPVDPELVPVEWDWDRIFWDPHSRKHDFSDARYLGGILWMDAEEAKRRWSEKAGIIDLTVNDLDTTRTYADRPNRWVSKSSSGTARHRVCIVQMYHLEGGQWMHCTFVKGGKLEEMTVPFVDEKGHPWCPMIMQSAYVDRENNRYGLVRRMIGVQDEINKRRSKALHRLTMRQVKTEAGAVDDVDLAKREMSKPDGFLVVNPGFQFELLEHGQDVAAELQLLQEAKNEIELMGPNAAMMGTQENAPSGKAIQANQQSGQTSLAKLMDRHRNLKKRVYEGAWNLIRQYKKQEWWVRVTDDEKNVKFVGFNRPVTMKEELITRLQKSGAPEEEIAPQLQQIEMMAQQDPRLSEVVRTENVAADMHMDINIEEVPDVASIQEEQFQQLTALAPAVVFPPAVYIEASSLRNKKRLLEMVNGEQQVDPVQAEIQKITTEQAIKRGEAEIQKLKAETLKITVDADVADAQIGQIVQPNVVGAGAESAAPESVPAAEAEPGAPAEATPPPG